MTEETLFEKAAAITDPSERAALLDQACGDDRALRDRVEALLKANEVSDDFLAGLPDQRTPGTDIGSDLTNASAKDPTIDHDRTVPDVGHIQDQLAPDSSGEWIGPYRLVRKIGEGGMGHVYLAEQERPVRREVALKVIKPGMDTALVVRRFEAERQALAIMDHPHIAKVLDAGATDAGRPFFVMELVAGEPITDYCDRHHLPPTQRLDLFISVCQAIQHAHQKGIIHRDVKPSNVLVSMIDGKSVLKVIDFGIAKAIDQNQIERTMFTQTGAIVGTPEYMSPEQAGAGRLDVDTRTDIYALGVLLYELLTGSTPLERERLRQAAFLEILRRIREEEPPRPSTRLSGSGDRLAGISVMRGVEPSRLTKLVRGDLDWIVMKALEKDRTRRYETANGLARDIQRHLDGDPVEACPPSTRYKMWKFARKHRAAILTTGAFALLLFAATAISVGLAVWANRERHRAVKAEELAKDQQVRAQEREQMAIDAVKRFRDAVTEEPELKNTPALEGLRKRLLKEPLSFFRALRNRLQSDADTRPESLARLAQASFELGRLTDEIGSKQDAIMAFRESLEVYQKLADANPTNTQFQQGLAASHKLIGNLVLATGKPSVTFRDYEAARAIWQKLSDDHPTVIEYQGELATIHINIGFVLRVIGKTAEAMKAHEVARVTLQKLANANPTVTWFRRELGQSHLFTGRLLRETGRPDEAMKAFEEALAIRQTLADANPSVTLFQIDLADCQANIGAVLFETGKTTEAMKAFEAALAIRRDLAEANPAVTAFQASLAVSYTDLALLLGDTGRVNEAIESHETALAIRRKLVDANPTVSRFQARLADSLAEYGNWSIKTGKPDEAMQSYEAARLIWRKLADAYPAIVDFQFDAATIHINILLSEIGKPEEAMQAYEMARKKLQGIADTNPTVPHFQRELAQSHYYRGLLLSQTGRPDEAMQALEAALAIYQRLADANPTVTKHTRDLVNCLFQTGVLRKKNGKPAEAMKAWEASLAFREKMTREHAESPDFASHVGTTLHELASLDLDALRFEQARVRLLEAVQWQSTALASSPENTSYMQSLANHLVSLIHASEALGLCDEADQARGDLYDLSADSPAAKALNDRLSAVLSGQPPNDDTERIALAFHAYRKAHYATATRLLAEALADDPKLSEDRIAQHRYHAARAAAIAAAGRGKDDPPPDDSAKAKLRRQALDWLKAELSAWKRVVMTVGPGNKETVAKTLKHWKSDSDLAGIRDEAELAKLPEEERAAFKKLWAEVDGLLAKISVAQ